MMQGKRKSFTVFFIFLASIISSFIVLNRWIVTDIGFLSYGRIWQLYISYADFGFFRRGFIGTFFSETGVNSLFENEYIFAFFIHHLAVIALAAMLVYFCISRGLTNLTFTLGIAFSPALIIYYGYNTGALDVFVLIFAALNILLVRNVILFCIILVIGMLTHELFLFTVPAQIIAITLFYREQSDDRSLRVLAFPIVTILLVTIAVTLFGKVEVSQDAVEEIMRQKLPTATEQHGLWSGYVEIARSAEENLTGSIKGLVNAIKTGFIFLAIPLIYIVILSFRLLIFSRDRHEGICLLIAVVVPLLTALVATDLYRWIAMSANMAILLTLLVSSQQKSTKSRWNTPLLFFCLLAPFGNAEISHPFPMHQFILDRLLP